MTDLELGWAAGFYEGEGYCRARKGGGGLEVIIGQTSIEPLQSLQQIIGGSIRPGNAIKYNSHAKPNWMWSIGGEKARRFLQSILPLIRAPYKINQINSALQLKLAVRRWARNPERLQAMINAVNHMQPHQRYGEEIKTLAARFGVSPKTIYNIRERYFSGAKHE